MVTVWENRSQVRFMDQKGVGRREMKADRCGEAREQTLNAYCALCRATMRRTERPERWGIWEKAQKTDAQRLPETIPA